SYNLGAGTASVVTNVPSLETLMISIGVDLSNNLLAGIVDDNTTSHSGHQLKIDNIANLSTPTVVSNFYFLTNSSGINNTNPNFAGAVDGDGSRIFALDTQNGVVALKILYASSTPVIETHPQSRTNIAG